MSLLARLRGRPKGASLGGGLDLERPVFWSRRAGVHEKIENDFEGYVEQAYKANGIVFACILARMLPFAEARFQYQRFNRGRPGDLFGDPSLSLLENPWPNGTTGELLARMEQDGSLAGNFYATTVGTASRRRIRRLRPDWVTIVSGVRGDDEASPFDLEGELIGYLYTPIDRNGRRTTPVLLTPEQVVHYSPIPDPMAQWRGMSWLTPVLREIDADLAATKHKTQFFQRGAAMNLVVSGIPAKDPEAFEKWVAAFEAGHVGVDNAYKTLYLTSGADVTLASADLKQLDFKAVQGAGETRIAAASGVGAIIARFSEGLAGSSLNQGNYGAAKRQVADMLLRPNWRMAAAALTKFTQPPSGARLWYDDRDIPFLHEDAKDAGEIWSTDAQSMQALIVAGYEPDSVTAATAARDPALLVHTGLPSVQLQPAPATTPSEES